MSKLAKSKPVNYAVQNSGADDPFTAALAGLEQNRPPEVAFEVPAHLFRNLASFDVANRIASTMEAFKARAQAAGYVVTTTYARETGMWQYHLRHGEDGPTALLYVPPIDPPAPLQLPVVYEPHGLDTQTRVCFYEHDFYVLSNFSAFALMWKGIKFDTSEAAYHWEKFNDDSSYWVRDRIQLAMSAHVAFKLAEESRELRRKDWDKIKVGIMCEILWAKVQQHEYVLRKLLATGERELVEDSWRDTYWGIGPKGDGMNMLGKLWMGIRGSIQANGGRVIPPGWARP